jgi:hypothetical protein
MSEFARDGGNAYNPACTRFVGYYLSPLDDVTYNVYEDPDGRQWITGEVGRQYGNYLPREYKQALRASAVERSTPPAAGSQGNDRCPKPVLPGLVSDASAGPRRPTTDASPKPELQGSHLPPDSQARKIGGPSPRPEPNDQSAKCLCEKSVKCPVFPAISSTSRTASKFPVLKTVLAICGMFFLFCGGFVYAVGLLIAHQFKIAVGWGVASSAALFVSILLSYTWFMLLKEKREQQEKERKKLEHEAWLRSPQGMAQQAEEREKQRKQQEEEERQRKEAEELAARAKWREYQRQWLKYRG